MADQPKRQQEIIDKQQLFLTHLEERAERVRAMLDTFVRQFDDLTPQQRVVMLRRVHETSSQLIGQVLAIAKNFGDNEELVAELKPVLRAKNWEKADGTTDYGAYI